MAQAKESHAKDKSNEPPECFVIMPIADSEGYAPGHWGRVFQHLIKPACEKAGFKAVLASEVQQTNFIILDILKRIVSSEMVLCDLSSRNPNVLYELGIRQAFDKPLTLIKDSVTSRIFDVQGLRDVEYDPSLRIDTVNQKVLEISQALTSTAKAKDDVNSIIRFLGITPAKLPPDMPVSADTSLILEHLTNLSLRLGKIESGAPGRASAKKEIALISPWQLSTGEILNVGTPRGESLLVGLRCQHPEFGPCTVHSYDAESDSALVFLDNGQIELVKSPLSVLVVAQ